MEIKPQMTMCPEGHFFNAAKHTCCPICNPDETKAPVQTAKPEESTGSFSPTIAPEDLTPPAENFSPTIAPDFDSAAGSFSPTIAPDFASFDVPTCIGNDACVPEGLVVGWLVCIEGPNRGCDYRIRAGYNYIGRDTGDIAIRGDQQISRQNHAMIAYDESECAFYVGPSAGRNLIKVNNKAVLSPIDLNNFDIISIGSTKLLFVALCGEQFDWNKVSAND